MIKVTGKKGQTADKLGKEVIAALSATDSEENVLKVKDIDWAVDSYLYGSVKELLSTKVKSVCEFNYQVRFVGFKAPSIKICESGRKLADILNEVCSAYQVVGRLGTAIQLDLHWDVDMPETEPHSVYVQYIAFTPQAAKVIDKLMKMKAKTPFFKECEIPLESV